jgi:hypothetical protein
MHKIKADYLRDRFPEKDCFSAITTIELDNMTVGTPVVANIKPFAPSSTPRVYSVGPRAGQGRAQFANNLQVAETGLAEAIDAPPQPARNSQSPAIAAGGSEQIVVEPSRDRQLYYSDSRATYRSNSKAKAAPMPLSNVKKVSAKDLYEMGVVEANKVLQSGAKISTMFVFSFYKDYQDFYIHSMQSHQVYFDGKKPLIFDKGYRFELERLADVHKKDELNNFSEMIYDSLKENRYVNYSFERVATSNKKYMFEDINTIFNDLQRVFPKNFSFFTSVLNNGTLRSLVDTVSISFYRMQDVIAIFDSRETFGMGVEIFLTNSAHKPIHMNELEATATYRFLFSKSRENILIIDGELIKRQHNRATGDALGSALSVIGKNIPIDDKLKKDKTKTISVE